MLRDTVSHTTTVKELPWALEDLRCVDEFVPCAMYLVYNKNNPL